MDGTDLIAVEIQRRLRRVALQAMRPGGAEMLPLPRPDLFSQFQARPVNRADIVVAPVSPARRQVDGFTQRLIRLRFKRRPFCFRPRRGRDPLF